MADRPDEIELAAENAADRWPDLVEPATLPIEQLVDRASSLEEVRDGLLQLDRQIDVEPLVEHLARGQFSARLAGDAAIGRETKEAAGK